MKEIKCFVYGKNLKDLAGAIKQFEEDYKDCDFTPICERNLEREGFAVLLDMVNRGDIVYISAIQTLRDSNNYKTMIKNMRKLYNKGVILKIGLQPDFSYESYEKWYAINEQIQAYEGIFRVHFDVDDKEVEYLNMSEELPEFSYSACIVEEDYYMWI